MVETQMKPRSSVARWGWVLLMLVSALYALNGIGWFFAGPDAVITDLAERIGMTAAEFDSTYPEAAFGEAREARWVAIYLTSIGLMSLLAAVDGFRRGTRWSWYITWVLVATIAAALANGLANGELGFFGMALLTLLVLALAGQLMAARKGTAVMT